LTRYGKVDYIESNGREFGPLILCRPHIQTANDNAPTHSRIVREAIIFSKASQPLPRTPKGNVARAAALKLYEDDIARMYAQLGQNSSLTSLGVPGSWKDQCEVEFWLMRCVNHLLGRELYPCEDLFQQGLDRYACIEVGP
jgi:hypothetical protein